MIKIFTTILCSILFLVYSAQDLAITKYNLLSQKGEFCYYTNDFQCAIFNYEKSLIHIDSMLLFDQLHLALSYIKTNDELLYKNAFTLLEQILSKGYPFSELNKRVTTNFKSSEYYKKLEENKKSYRLKFYENYDIDLIIELTKWLHADKYIRSNCPQEDSICEQVWLKTINNNFDNLENEILKNGFPGFKQVGFHAMDVNIMLLHGKSKNLSLERFNRLKDIIYQEVLKGNFSPSSFAYWVDGYHTAILKDEQVYGTVYHSNKKVKVISKHISEKVMDKERKKIGLIPIREYCNNMNISVDFE